jgi:mutator protein MutT
VGSREYPDRPVVGIGAVIVQDGKVLLVKRRYAPLKGEWSLPGGGVEVGETLEECVVREMREETGLDIEVGPVIEVFDRITHDTDGRVQYHYVLVDYLCWPIGGELNASSDVEEAVWVQPDETSRFNITAKATAVIERALMMARQAPWPARDAAGPGDPPNAAGDSHV